jgi:hypothetical protein
MTSHLSPAGRTPFYHKLTSPPCRISLVGALIVGVAFIALTLLGYLGPLSGMGAIFSLASPNGDIAQEKKSPLKSRFLKKKRIFNNWRRYGGSAEWSMRLFF